MKNRSLEIRLIVMNFLEFAVWGAYLTSMGTYLATHGMANNIGWFYSVQGIVSIFMPADVSHADVHTVGAVDKFQKLHDSIKIIERLADAHQNDI